MSASESDLARAVALLQSGELVGVPTETVYGLAADASRPDAVAKIFAAKGRPADHPLIVHVADASHLPFWAKDIPEAAYRLAEKFWPGPLTLILKRQPTVPDAVTGGQETVGLRVPNHPLTLALLRQFAAAGGSGAVAAPSANRFGRISPTTADHVREELGAQVALVLDGGPCTVGIESTIVDLSRGAPVILRPGAISAAEIEAVLGLSLKTPGEAGAKVADTPRVSGALEAHYAPRTPMIMASSDELLPTLERCLSQGKRVAVFAFAAPSMADARVVWRQASADPVQYAHDLYATLRDLDHLGFDLILLEALPTDTEQAPRWLAVADRLRRAVHGAGQS